MNMTAWFICGGGGGGTIGAIAANIKPVLNVDYNPKNPELSKAIAQSYEENLNSPVVQEDFCEWVKRKEHGAYEKPDFIVASMPCTNFSQANVNGQESAFDIELASSFVTLIEDVLPDHIWLENVPQWKESKAWQTVKKGLSKHYSIDEKVVLASMHGVPQNRRRFIVRCSRTKQIGLSKIPGSPSTGWYKAIEDLLPTFKDNHLTGAQKRRIVPPWKGKNTQQLNLFNQDSSSVFLSPRIGIFKDYKIVPADKPCWTITSASLVDITRKRGRNSSIDVICFPYLEDIRKEEEWFDLATVKTLSRRAIARLMSFPDWYQLPTNTFAAGHLLGQSIPPKLAECIFRSFLL